MQMLQKDSLIYSAMLIRLISQELRVWLNMPSYNGYNAPGETVFTIGTSRLNGSNLPFLFTTKVSSENDRCDYYAMSQRNKLIRLNTDSPHIASGDVTTDEF
jgi:hypothetical protein